jgi:hypothetical protein
MTNDIDLGNDGQAARATGCELSAAIPVRMRKLKLDALGRPVPWFAKWRNGFPLFSHVSGWRRRMSMRSGVCQICGQPLDAYSAFVLGPVQVETRGTMEGPAHPGCARYALQACPFLSNPARERHDIKSDNPGVFALWVTRHYELGRYPNGDDAVIVGDPVRVQWWKARRLATADEIAAAQQTARRALEVFNAGQGDTRDD